MLWCSWALMLQLGAKIDSLADELQKAEQENARAQKGLKASEAARREAESEYVQWQYNE